MKNVKERNDASKYLNDKGVITSTTLDNNSISKAVDTLMDAFKNYRMLNWMHMDKLNDKKFKDFFTIELKTCNETSIFLSDSEDYNSFAILQPSTNTSASFTTYVGSGGLNLIKDNGFRCVGRMLKYSDYITKYRINLVGEEPWYIYYLGTKKAYQGKGLGTNLLKNILDYMDYINKDLYIETNELNNVTYYEKFGFKLIDEFKIADFKGYCMLRKPKTK